MADDAGIDPRYAAQFQRGFDASVHVAPPAPVPTGPPRISSGPPAVAQRVAPPPPLVERPVPVEEVVDTEDEVEDDLPAVRPRLEWALLGTGLAMIVLSIVVFVTWITEQRKMYAGNYMADFDSLLASTVYENVPGPLFVAGVVAVILWVVLRAVSPARGRG